MQFKLPKGEIQLVDASLEDGKRYVITSNLHRDEYYLYRLKNGKFIKSTKVRKDPLFKEVYPDG